MIWQIQSIVELCAQWISSEAGTNVMFAGLCLWAASGRRVWWCGAVGAALHLVVAFG